MIQEKAFIKYLKDNGYSQNTIAKYRHDLRLLKKVPREKRTKQRAPYFF